LLDAPLKRLNGFQIKSNQRIQNAFLDLEREYEHFQFERNHCSLTRAPTNQTITEQDNSIKNGILKLYENQSCVSMAIGAGTIHKLHFLDVKISFGRRSTPVVVQGNRE
jgi:hypothetical protein